MDIQASDDDLNRGRNTPLSDANSPLKDRARTKSELRIKYEAEKRALRGQLGELEDIRRDLGLSQRKMAQLLMVDPSAWTRWIQNPEKVPPHVYRSLQWYLELIDKKPQWRPENSFGPLTQKVETQVTPEVLESQSQLKQELKFLKAQSKEWIGQVLNLKETLNEQNQTFAEKVDNKDTALAVWKLFVLLNTIVLFFWLVWNLL